MTPNTRDPQRCVAETDERTPIHGERLRIDSRRGAADALVIGCIEATARAETGEELETQMRLLEAALDLAETTGTETDERRRAANPSCR